MRPSSYLSGHTRASDLGNESNDIRVSLKPVVEQSFNGVAFEPTRPTVLPRVDEGDEIVECALARLSVRGVENHRFEGVDLALGQAELFVDRIS